MVFAVVKRGAEIGHGKSGEIAANGGVANPLFHGWNPVSGDSAAKHVIDKFDAFAAFERFIFNAADSELAVAAGLLFVFAFGVGFAANGFAVWNLRRLERH